jgi:O-methyltransferase
MTTAGVTLDLCMRNTMVPQSHLLYLETIINQVNQTSIQGALVECGVYKGGCVMWMAQCQKKHNTNRFIYLYDTFEGMTYPQSEKDDPNAKKIWNETHDGIYHRDYDKWHGQNKWAYCPLDMVRNNIGMMNYDPSKIKYVVGDVCQTLNLTENLPDRIAILRLDTDWFDSTKKEIDVLFPKVSVGGYLIVDDYYAWKGSKTATDEFLMKHKNVGIIDPSITGNIMVIKRHI